jgi:hypothetical protein
MEVKTSKIAAKNCILAEKYKFFRALQLLKKDISLKIVFYEKSYQLYNSKKI